MGADPAYDFSVRASANRARSSPSSASTRAPMGPGPGPRFRAGEGALAVERAFAWLHQFKRRLRIRYERRAGLHQGLLASS